MILAFHSGVGGTILLEALGAISLRPEELIPMARLGAVLCLLMPAYQVAQSWFQGLLVHAHQTRPITEAVLIYFVLAWGLLELGVLRADDLGVSGQKRFGQCSETRSDLDDVGRPVGEGGGCGWRLSTRCPRLRFP